MSQSRSNTYSPTLQDIPRSHAYESDIERTRREKNAREGRATRIVVYDEDIVPQRQRIEEYRSCASSDADPTTTRGETRGKGQRAKHRRSQRDGKQPEYQETDRKRLKVARNRTGEQLGYGRSSEPAAGAGSTCAAKNSSKAGPGERAHSPPPKEAEERHEEGNKRKSRGYREP
ncbi:unnamed protein product [Pleuronectes platessa]|uniref:Uncharacterized protein n=1 Tax=Pleuronectes platessa TaxID=8262 RepID=A0A9N7U721_PLEPL|nr:unnamed protein product [Pleuronectes platessa]